MKNRLVLIGEQNQVELASKVLSQSYSIAYTIITDDDWYNTVSWSVDEDIVVCAGDYLSIGKRLFDSGLGKYYVFVEGFMYLCDYSELMQPVEVHNLVYFYKSDNVQKTMLFVRSLPIAEENQIVENARKEGFYVILLSTMGECPSDNIYDECVRVTSMRGLIEYIERSEIDLIVTFSEDSGLACIALAAQKPVIFSASGDGGKRKNTIMEYMIYKNCAGLHFRNGMTKAIFEKNYGTFHGDCFRLGNLEIESNAEHGKGMLYGIN